MTATRNISQKACASIPLISDAPQYRAVSFVEVEPDEEGQRLDNFLFRHLRTVPRTRVYRIIRKGEVRVNKKRAKPETRLQSGDQVRLPPIQLSSETSPADPPPRLLELIDNNVLFENEHLIVINKPESVAVHAGSGLHFGIIDLVRQSRQNERIELVHRLDRDTSGCLMLAKSRKSLLHFQAALKQREMTKTYLAIVHGKWPSELTFIDEPLLKTLGGNAERRVKVDVRGKAAQTRLKRIHAMSDFSVLQLELITGRTHQIRVHCQHSGHPIVGDSKYGDAARDKAIGKVTVGRLMLHAWRLDIPGSSFSEQLNLMAPVPDVFKTFVGEHSSSIFH